MSPPLLLHLASHSHAAATFTKLWYDRKAVHVSFQRRTGDFNHCGEPSAQ